MTKIDSQHKAELLTAAIKERKAIRLWERNGADPEQRPETPAMDEIDGIHARPKSERTKSNGQGRQPSPKDQLVRDLFMNGTLSTPSTLGEIAAAAGLPNSSTYHVKNRLVASGELVLTEGRPELFWLTAAGKPGKRPERQTASRSRKVHAVKGKGGKVAHAAHARRGENGTEYTATCTDVEIVEPTKVGDESAVTCKRCLKALAEQAAA